MLKARPYLPCPATIREEIRVFADASLHTNTDAGTRSMFFPDSRRHKTFRIAAHEPVTTQTESRIPSSGAVRPCNQMNFLASACKDEIGSGRPGGACGPF